MRCLAGRGSLWRVSSFWGAFFAAMGIIPRWVAPTELLAILPRVAAYRLRAVHQGQADGASHSAQAQPRGASPREQAALRTGVEPGSRLMSTCYRRFATVVTLERLRSPTPRQLYRPSQP